MDWGTIGLWVAAALVLWFAWQTYLEQQMEATALRAARAARERWAVPAQDMDLAQLRKYDGSDPDKTILVSVNGRIYNVWRGRSLYVSGGTYELFAGRECGVALSQMSFETSDLDKYVENLSDSAQLLLSEWMESYEMKHDFVGNLRDPGWGPGHPMEVRRLHGQVSSSSLPFRQ